MTEGKKSKSKLIQELKDDLQMDNDFFNDVKKAQKKAAIGGLIMFPIVIFLNLAVLAVAVWVVVKVLQLTGVL